MRNVLLFFILIFICQSAHAVIYCKRFPTDTAVACYGPDYPPPSSGTVSPGTIGQEAVYTGTTSVGSGIITDTGTNIGIGSLLPSQKLDVNGTIRSSAFQTIGGTSSSFVKGDGSLDSSTYLTNVGIGTTNDIALWTSSNTIGASNNLVFVGGNLGIGSSTPGQKLDVQGTVRAISYLGDGSQLSGITNYWTASGSTIYNNNSGNVGIGTNSPQYILDLNGGGVDLGNSVTQNWYIGSAGNFYFNGIGKISQSLTLNEPGAASPALLIYDNNSNINFKVGNNGSNFDYVATLHNVLDNGTTGNMGIGSTSPGQKLDVQGTARMTGFQLSTSPSSGYVLTSNSVGVGTWQAIPPSSNYWTQGAGNIGIGTTTNNVGIGTVQSLNSSLVVVGNIGIGTIKGDSYVTISAPNGGLIAYGNVGIGTWMPNDSLSVSSLTGGVSIIGNIAGIGGIDNYNKLMMHMDGTNGSTTFTDSEIAPKTFTAHGGAQISTSQFEFGGASYVGNGTNSYITTPGSSDFTFTGDFTIDFWVYISSYLTNVNIIDCSNGAGSENGWRVGFDTNNNTIQFDKVVSDAQTKGPNTPALSLNTWYNIEIDRSGSSIDIATNGTFTGSPSTIAGTISGNLTSGLSIGSDYASSPGRYFTGYIDEVRISNGIARHTTNFTPATSAYTLSLSLPTLTFYNSSGAVLSQIKANSNTNALSIINNGVTSQTIDSIGNIGIGSSTPGQLLDVLGNIRAVGTNQFIAGSDNSVTIGASASSSGAMLLDTNSLERLRITNAGNVGIGSTVPAGALDMNTGSLCLSHTCKTTWPAGTVTSITAGTGLSGGVITTSGTINSNASQVISYQPGLLSAVNSTIGVYGKLSNASTVDNIVCSAITFSCISNPTITMYECGTSSTCVSPTTIGTCTVTSLGTAFNGTVSSSAITAGDYVGWAQTAGTCASIDIAATAQVHSN